MFLRRLLVLGASLLMSSGDATSATGAPIAAVTLCVGHDRNVAPEALVPRVLSLRGAAASLDEGERTRLEDALATAVSRWETRRNPLVDTLEDVDPDASLHEWAEHRPSPFAIADAVRVTSTCADDGFCVKAQPAGECSSGWRAPSGRDQERAQFLLWAWSHALRWRAPDRATFENVARMLRARSRDRASMVGLVVTRSEHPALAELERGWMTRAMLAEELAEDPTPALPVALEELELLVFPRLEVVRAPRGLVDEVEAAIRSLR